MDSNLAYTEGANFLVRAAHANAIAMYRPLSEQFPELCEVAVSGLHEDWDYFVTIASVGLAFMLLADSFKNEQDSDGMASAIQKALNE